MNPSIRRWREYGSACLARAHAVSMLPVHKGGRGMEAPPGYVPAKLRRARVKMHLREARWAYTGAARYHLVTAGKE